MDYGKRIEVGMKGDAKGVIDSYCWTVERMELLIDVCIDYSRKGYKLKTSFTEDGWAHILKEYNNKRKKQITIQQLKNIWNILKATWAAWKFSESNTDDWGWNTTLETVDPPSEKHWNALVKKHIFESYFKNIPLGSVAELQELFHNVVVDGVDAVCTNNDNSPASPKGFSASNNAINLDADDSSDGGDDVLPVELPDMRKKKNKQKMKRSTGPSSKRLRIGHQNCDTSETLTEMLALDKQNRTKMIVANIDNTYIEAYQILNSLERIEIGSNHHVMALEVLEDRNKREAFIAMHERARIPWLLGAIERKVRGGWILYLMCMIDN
ncbi:L10-interacting MYB domain-containing protein-like [Telopea speciosissima]|uniref:L10-interacting MYB domain-containing protein-like n=1 Tax=Telopea speciosissima TaxID=54955 RepID=UPI001CC40CCF|nr:L10-interacting MYB domain-containing protein-like [Telopea speciosissima]